MARCQRSLQLVTSFSVTHKLSWRCQTRDRCDLPSLNAPGRRGCARVSRVSSCAYRQIRGDVAMEWIPSPRTASMQCRAPNSAVSCPLIHSSRCAVFCMHTQDNIAKVLDLLGLGERLVDYRAGKCTRALYNACGVSPYHPVQWSALGEALRDHAAPYTGQVVLLRRLKSSSRNAVGG